MRDLHTEHLPSTETILLVCGGGDCSLVLTSVRLCWKNILEAPRHMLLADLQVGMVGTDDREIRLSGTAIEMLGTSELVEPLVDLLERIASGEIPVQRPPQVGGGERGLAMRQAFMDNVGVVKDLFYGPSLPTRKEEGARHSYGDSLPSDTPIIVLFDDTVFGSAEEGFVVTAEKLYWKGIMNEPQQESWSELTSLSVTRGQMGLLLGERDLHITARDELIPPLIKAITACAQYGKEPALSAPEPLRMLRCDWCGRRNRSDDPICDGCGAPT